MRTRIKKTEFQITAGSVFANVTPPPATTTGNGNPRTRSWAEVARSMITENLETPEEIETYMTQPEPETETETDAVDKLLECGCPKCLALWESYV